MMKRLRNSFGYSVAELATAVAVSGVVASAALPTAGQVYTRYQLAGTAHRVAFELTRARMQAVGQNRHVRIVIGTASVQRQTSDDGVTYVTDGDITLPNGISVSAGDSGSPSFNRSGLAPVATTLIIRQGTNGPAKIVSINTLGRVKVS